MRFYRSRQFRFAGLRVGGLTGRRPFGLASLRSDLIVIPAKLVPSEGGEPESGK